MTGIGQPANLRSLVFTHQWPMALVFTHERPMIMPGLRQMSGRRLSKDPLVCKDTGRPNRAVASKADAASGRRNRHARGLRAYLAVARYYRTTGDAGTSHETGNWVTSHARSASPGSITDGRPFSACRLQPDVRA